jgi:hypothetical protein
MPALSPDGNSPNEPAYAKAYSPNGHWTFAPPRQRIFDMKRAPIFLPPETPPILSVIVHVQAEFGRNASHDRHAADVGYMRHIRRAQALFDEFGIAPNYVVDYPIAATESAAAPLKAFADSGRASIGALLTPWNSPPYAEKLNAHNSYPGNLPEELEREKLRQLTEKIAESFGAPPLSYLAGRHGFGPRTGSLLEELGYEVDLSPAVPLDLSEDGGPDYSHHTCHPYWFGARRRLLGLPGSGGYVGLFRRRGTPLYRRLAHPALRRTGISGLMAKAGLFERIRLSPENYSGPEMRRLTRALVGEGQRVLVFGFHAPSMVPGGTPYVETQLQLVRFLDQCRRYFEFFLGELDGIAMTPLALKERLEALESGSAPSAS